MAQTGFTPISLYYTATAAATPTAGNLVAGELAINTNDGKLFYKDSAGVVQTIASKDTNSGTFTNLTVSGVASFADGTVSLPSITNIGDTNTGIYFPAADTIAFTEGGVESMRIDSAGNLGLGVTPSAWQSTRKALQIGAQSSISSEAAATLLALNFYADSGGTSRYIGTGNASLYNQFSGNHVWYTAPSGTAGGAISLSESMRIDSSGNVGIGTSSPSSKLDVVSSSDVKIRFKTTGTGTTAGIDIMGNNSTVDSTNVILYQGGNDEGYLWNRANSYFSFATNNTERMRIDSSGNVMVGTTSPIGSSKFSVQTGGGAVPAMYLYSPSTTNGAQIVFSDNLYSAYITGLPSGGATGLGFGASGSERMRIDSSGNVGIGTSSPAGKLQVVSANNTDTTVIGSFDANNQTQRIQIGFQSIAQYSAADPIRFLTGGLAGTERMRIDSDGNLLVGTTSSSGTITTKASTSNGSTNAFQAQNSASTQLCAIRSDGLFNLGLAANSPYNYTTGSGANAFLNASGELQRSTSSLKYKTDVQNATFGIADVMKLRPVTYKGKSETDGDTIYAGLIAEEVDSAGLKEFVQYAEDGTPDALSYGNMVALAFKAIQEQQAMIETLTTRLNALEGK